LAFDAFDGKVLFLGLRLAGLVEMVVFCVV